MSIFIQYDYFRNPVKASLTKMLERRHPTVIEDDLMVDEHVQESEITMRHWLVEWYTEVGNETVKEDIDINEFKTLMERSANPYFKTDRFIWMAKNRDHLLSHALEEMKRCTVAVLRERWAGKDTFTFGEVIDTAEFKNKWEKATRALNYNASLERKDTKSVKPLVGVSLRASAEAIHKSNLINTKRWMDAERIIIQEADRILAEKAKEAEAQLKTIANKEAEEKEAKEAKKKADEETKKATECPADIKAILHTIPAKPKGYKDGAGVWRGASKAQIENWEKKYGHLKKWLKKI